MCLCCEFALTLRKLSRDPFSMYSVTIMTGLPVEEEKQEGEGLHSHINSVYVTQQKLKVVLRFIFRKWLFGECVCGVGVAVRVWGVGLMEGGGLRDD